MENRQKPEQSMRGIQISKMNAAIIVSSFLLYILLTATAIHVSMTIHDTYYAMDRYFGCVQLENLLRSGTRELTEQVRLYVLTGDETYRDNYFQELHENRSRERAVQYLGELGVEGDALKHLQAALEQSNALVEREFHAMALVALAKESPCSTLPQEVQDIELTAGERAMAPEKLMERAKELVFDAEYQNARLEIEENVEDSLYALNDTTSWRMEQGYESLERAMVVHQALIAVHFAATVIGFLFTLRLVVLPMRGYVKAIRERRNLREAGAYECKCLAHTCNVMFERNQAHELQLRHQAEHDALTGLLNRGAFDALQQELSAQAEPTGLLLVDVDKFKQVNDGYGHEMGDRVLQTVASLLSEHFRTTDYPARIGGDEFAVILTNASPERTAALQAKIETINHTLTHPTGGLPVVSLSVGGAFSQNGFSEDLYKHADLALYEVKEHGRCGCRFYQGEP